MGKSTRQRLVPWHHRSTSGSRRTKIDFTPAASRRTVLGGAVRDDQRTVGSDSLRSSSIALTGANASSYKYAALTTASVPCSGGTFVCVCSVLPGRHWLDDGGSGNRDRLQDRPRRQGSAHQPRPDPKVVTSPASLDFGAGLHQDHLDVEADSDHQRRRQGICVRPSKRTRQWARLRCRARSTEGKILKRVIRSFSTCKRAWTAMQQTGEISIIVNDQIKMATCASRCR